MPPRLPTDTVLRRRRFAVVAIAALAATAAGSPHRVAAAPLGDADAGRAIRAALERGVQAAVARLGRPDGFLGDPAVRIGLPAGLERVAKLLRAAGQGRQIDELVTAMNRAAETAVPRAQALLVQTARQVTLADAVGIVRGGATSVTDYFASKTRPALTQELLPIVAGAVEKVALADRYDAFASRARAFGLVRDDDADLKGHVTRRALDGLYHVIGLEERRIRADPVGTGSAILRRVFGG